MEGLSLFVMGRAKAASRCPPIAVSAHSHTSLNGLNRKKRRKKEEIKKEEMVLKLIKSFSNFALRQYTGS